MARTKEEINKRHTELYLIRKQRVFNKLGDKCIECGTKENLIIHHIKQTISGRGRGRYERLRDWEKNIEHLKLLCEECHINEHYRSKKNGK